MGDEKTPVEKIRTTIRIHQRKYSPFCRFSCFMLTCCFIVFVFFGIAFGRADSKGTVPVQPPEQVVLPHDTATAQTPAAQKQGQGEKEYMNRRIVKHLIAPKILQIWLPTNGPKNNPASRDILEMTASWRGLNPTHA
jgi:hypothetical protein